MSNTPDTRQNFSSPFNGWYKRDPCVERVIFDPDRFYVLDGGLGSYVASVVPDAASVNENPLWTSGMTQTDPDVIREAHTAFLKAGANIITTNTYQCSVDLFKKNLDLFDPEMDSRRLFGRALQLADEAVESTVDGDALVVASIGPYGACLHDGSEYTGSYLDSMSVEDLEKWHFERIKRLAVAGAELLAVETMPSIVEAKAVLNVLRAFKGVQCWISFQCRDGATTARGERFDRVIKELIRHPAYSTRVVAVGVNCVAPKDVAPLLRLANRVNRYEEWPEEMTFRTVPYVVYPNSGEKWEDSQWSGDKEDLEDELVKRVPQWMKLGATVVGGCCRVTPEVISKISEKVKECAIDVFEYRRKHASVCKKDDFEYIKQRFIELGKIESRAKKDEIILPTDLIGRIEVLPPGHVDRDQAEAKLRKLFEHFNEPYPLDDTVDDTEEEPSDE